MVNIHETFVQITIFMTIMVNKESIFLPIGLRPHGLGVPAVLRELPRRPFLLPGHYKPVQVTTFGCYKVIGLCNFHMTPDVRLLVGRLISLSITHTHTNTHTLSLSLSPSRALFLIFSYILKNVECLYPGSLLRLAVRKC